MPFEPQDSEPPPLPPLPVGVSEVAADADDEAARTDENDDDNDDDCKDTDDEKADADKDADRSGGADSTKYSSGFGSRFGSGSRGGVRRCRHRAATQKSDTHFNCVAPGTCARTKARCERKADGLARHRT